LNHSRLLPPLRLQSVTVTAEKELPVESATSKNSPVEVNVEARTGSDPYCATVSAPTPAPLAVVPPLVAVAVPVELLDVAFAELVAPAGGAGAVGAGGGDPDEVIATVGEVEVIGVPPMVPLRVAVPAKVDDVNVAV
jgi:hypothetical protein